MTKKILYIFEELFLCTASTSSSPVIKAGFLDTSDSCVALEFEEIPSRHKQDILNALQVCVIS